MRWSNGEGKLVGIALGDLASCMRSSRSGAVSADCCLSGLDIAGNGKHATTASVQIRVLTASPK